METMVSDDTVSKVLIFSNKTYALKADKKEGGVGTESQIISPKMYENVKETKFIPILMQYDEGGQPCLPTFLSSRIYIDFTSTERFHQNYEMLVRAIYEKPLLKIPELGQPPAYILDETRTYLKMLPKLQLLRESASQERANVSLLVVDYLATMLDQLEALRLLEVSGQQIDDIVVQSISDTIPLRDEFMSFLRVVIHHSQAVVFLDSVTQFYEDALRFKIQPENTKSWHPQMNDNLSFFLYESYIYSIGLLLKYRKYDGVNILTNHAYMVPNEMRGRNSFRTFGVFRAWCESLEVRNKRLNLRRLSLVADLLHDRATLGYLPFSDIIQAEFVLLLKSILDPESGGPWYPYSLIYASNAGACELFARATYKKHFTPISILFQCATPDDFRNRFKAAAIKHNLSSFMGPMVNIHFGELANYDGIYSKD